MRGVFFCHSYPVNSGCQKARRTGRWKSGLLLDVGIWEEWLWISHQMSVVFLFLNSFVVDVFIYNKLCLVLAMFAAAESSIIFWLSIHILLLLWLRHHLIVMITFQLELNVSAHSKAAGRWRSGSLWVWFVSGWCCKLKSGRRLQMSSKRRLLFPCFGSVPLGTLAGTATGGYSYADTYQLHLLVFLDHVFIHLISVSFSIIPVSALVEDQSIKVTEYRTSLKLCWATMNESQWDVNTSRIIYMAVGSFWGVCFLPKDVFM